MKILATIAARGGSKGIKDKNIRNLFGKPLIAYTIEQAKAWNGYENLIVSTDSKKIAAIANSYGAEVPFLRPAGLSKDKTGKIDVLRHALIESEKLYDKRFDALLDLDVTSPLRSIDDIKNIVKLFKRKNIDCVFSVIEARKNPYFNMVEETPSGNVRICKKPNTYVLSRQSAPKVYEMNASIYLYKRDFLMDSRNKMPYEKTACVYEVKNDYAIDIDTESDFKLLELLLKEGLVKL